MTHLRVVTILAAILIGAGVPDDGARAAETFGKTMFYENGVAVSVIAFSQDGERLAFASDDRTVRIRETTNGNEVAVLSVPSALGDDDNYIHIASFSPDSTRLATASRDKTVRLWDITTGHQVAALEHPALAVLAVFSPDGTVLATSSGDPVVRLWDATAGNLIAELEHPAPVVLADFSPDSTRLATATADDAAHIWEVESRSELAILQGHADSILDLRFSPDATRVLTASADSTARIWDAADGEELLVLTHSEPATVAEFSADGTRIVTGSAADARIFDATEGREIAVLSGHPHAVTRARFSPDGSSIVTGADDGSVRVWDRSGELVGVLLGHSYEVAYAAFSPDGQRIFTTGGAIAIVWNKIEPASLPEEIVGLWFNDFDAEAGPVSPEMIRTMCLASPIRIDGDGLIVVFDGGYDSPPQPAIHMRCTSDLACQVFPGAPADAAEVMAEGNLTMSGDTGNLCLADDCRPIARCPLITWTDEERDSGFAEQWKSVVSEPAN